MAKNFVRTIPAFQPFYCGHCASIASILSQYTRRFLRFNSQNPAIESLSLASKQGPASAFSISTPTTHVENSRDGSISVVSTVSECLSIRSEADRHEMLEEGIVALGISGHTGRELPRPLDGPLEGRIVNATTM